MRSVRGRGRKGGGEGEEGEEKGVWHSPPQMW